MKFSELKCKEVINCRNGVRLGFVTDLDIDIVSGRICHLIVPEQSKWFGCFCPAKVIQIPYCNIVKIGPDVIVVSMECANEQKKGKNRN